MPRFSPHRLRIALRAFPVPPAMPAVPALLGVLLAAALALPSPAQGRGAAVTATVGASSRDHFRGGNFAFSSALYLKFDEMVLLGAQSGIGSLAGPSSVPILGAAMVRLPLGRVILPFACGDVGYVLDDENDGLLWRGGGGLDIKNGRHSSLLALGGYEATADMAGWYARGGLLLEF